MFKYSSHLPIGYILHKRYRIESLLGKSLVGYTYLATDFHTDQYVSIKEFFPPFSATREETLEVNIRDVDNEGVVEIKPLIKAFLKEKLSLSQILPPSITGIMGVYGAFMDNNTAYCVAEYIEGKSIEELVIQDGPLNKESAIKYISSIAQSVKYLHRRQIYNIIISPDNLMRRTFDKKIFITTLNNDLKEDLIFGKTIDHYGMVEAPAIEQKYRPLGYTYNDPKSALATVIFSLAATLYFMVSGTPPRVKYNEIIFPNGIPQELEEPLKLSLSLYGPEHPKSIDDFLSLLK